MNARAKKPVPKKALRKGREPEPYRFANTIAETRNDIVLYRSADGRVGVEVRIDADTVWLPLNQMAQLFGRDKSVISRHLKNVFATKELDRDSVVAKNATTAADGKVYEVEYFNLDAILSVGYRVNSKQGTQFRIWATQTLREHLIRGYTLNEKRLAERGLTEAQQAIELLSKTLTNQSLVTDQGRAVLNVVQQYTRAWRLLLEYDENRLPAAPASPVQPSAELTMVDAHAAIASLRTSLAVRGETTDLFGREREKDYLRGILRAIEQTFGGEPLYPTAQVRAAHLLYFVIKDHPFADGNKRIGTLLFLEYLQRNRLLLRPNGEPRLADNAMVALALLVAESDPKQKELMIKLVLNLLEQGT